MTQNAHPRRYAPAATFLMVGLLGAALVVAGCDREPAGAPTAPPTAAPTPPAAGGRAEPGTDVNAAVPMDDRAGEPATTWPAGGAPADATADRPDSPAASEAEDAPAAGAERLSTGGLSFELAEGWTLKPASGMRIGTVTDGTLEIALSSFPGDVGGKLANVNRWRQQVGLEPIAEAQLDDETRTIDVDGKQVLLVDAAGPEQRLLAASIPGDGKLYFAKMSGPTRQVAERKDAFEAFVKSIEVE